MIKKTLQAFALFAVLFFSYFATVSVTEKLYHKHVEYQIRKDYTRQVECLAKNIYYESATEPYEGKLAVAQVTINRTNNPNFPSDFCSVVYERNEKTCQFSWTCMQSYVKHPDEYTWEECMNIAKMAMLKPALHRELAFSKAIYYHATYISPGWKNVRMVKKIGSHVFYTPA
jgi:spore germination cell wall hydrolase CwlJ-like protein